MPIRLKSLLLRPFFRIARSCATPPPPDLTPPFRYRRYEGPGPIKMVNGYGCDDNHWLIRVKKPVVGSRDEIIDGYIQLVAQVLGSEDEARKQIYSVSTKYYFAIGVLVSRDVADKFKQLPDVVGVNEDIYVDRAAKEYGGEPFVDGKPVPYDPKHHAFYHRVQAILNSSDREKEATFKAWKWDPLGQTSKSEKEKEKGRIELEGTEMGERGSGKEKQGPKARIINIGNAKKKRALKLEEEKLAEERALKLEEEKLAEERWKLVEEEEYRKEAEEYRRWLAEEEAEVGGRGRNSAVGTEVGEE